MGQALLATLLWSLSKILIKLGVSSVSPILLAGLTQTIAFLALLVYGLSKRIKLTRKFSAKEFHTIIWLGVLGFILAPLLAIIGLTSLNASAAGLFAGINPILVMVLGWLILREKLSINQLVGGLVAFLGIYIFFIDNQPAGTAFGITLILISEICYALNTVLTRLIMRLPGDDALTLSLAGSFMGMLVLLPLALFQSNLSTLSQANTWVIALVLGLIFAFAGLIWNRALNYLKAFQAATLQNTMVVQIGLLSAIFLGEQFNLWEVVGAIIVLGGAYLVNITTHKRHHAKSRT